MRREPRLRVACTILLLISAGAWDTRAVASAQEPELPTRLIVMKFDGLPQEAVDRYVARIDPRTGRSVLPWIARLFYQGGVRFENFYSRGASLSETSWAILDTGQHSVVKGNFEADRSVGTSAFHLDLVSFYYDVFRSHRVYPQAVESLDESGTPLVSDAFRFEERETGLQLLRRGTKFYDMLKIGLNPVSGPAVDRLGDLVVGIDWTRAFKQTVREQFLVAVRDPSRRYVDMYWPSVDETIHDDNTEVAVRSALQEADREIGLAYEAIVRSGAADRTVLVVVSDHGATFELGGPYSQGINLVGYLTKRSFGANNVMTHHAPRANYTLSGSLFKPWPISVAITSAPEPFYLKDRPDQVTCALDFDGNERAQLTLRAPDLNRLQMLVERLRDADLAPNQRSAATAYALALVARHREGWLAEARAIREEVAAARRRAASDETEAARLKKAYETLRGAPSPPIPPFAGLSRLNSANRLTDTVQRSKEAAADAWRLASEADKYAEYAASLEARAALRTPQQLRDAPLDLLFGRYDLGERLSASDLLAYPVGLRAIALDADGRLDAAASFVTVDYLEALRGIQIRNAVRTDIGNEPVDFVAARVPLSDAVSPLRAAGRLDDAAAARVTQAYVLYRSDTDQLLMLEQPGTGGFTDIMLVPVTHMRLASDAGVAYDIAAWHAGLPLGLFEDPALRTASTERVAWLSAFHTDREWLAATHRTTEGLGVTGLAEVFSTAYRDAFATAIAGETDPDRALVRRFALRRRDAVQPDMFLHATPGWNFDLKDFNPGGNHGGFSRTSMHAVLWMIGGSATRVERGPVRVQQPYDGLDFAPTIFEAAGITTDGVLSPELERGGFRPFPGRIAWEALKENEPLAESPRANRAGT